MPASAHGGIQWWYGSLQVGPFFTHWFDNPRDVFGQPVFPSARPDGRPLVASSLKPIGGNCDGVVPQTVGVTYWTDRDPTRVSLPLRPWQEGGVHFEIPPQLDDTAIYYYYDAHLGVAVRRDRAADSGGRSVRSPRVLRHIG
jgi:hypothetical protein